MNCFCAVTVLIPYYKFGGVELNGEICINKFSNGSVLSLRHDNCRRQIVQSTAISIETGYRRKNPFLAGRISFKCVPPQTGAKKNTDFRWIPPIRNGSSLA
ncbi:hypothetical protein AVEN_146188-1 [Araneus ventricosus]|uniref:Uncharacterized protein n=1 Tax=Araneus ventricosus TaxID=182803 RepID=A0A4Y2CIP1_ARAVE|nr:hypothetical protein AVEN_146188-1 [Araneus ventricosus]